MLPLGEHKNEYHYHRVPTWHVNLNLMPVYNGSLFNSLVWQMWQQFFMDNPNPNPNIHNSSLGICSQMNAIEAN